jgi:hypothetical protein
MGGGVAAEGVRGAKKEKDAGACPGGMRGYDEAPDGSGEVQWPLEVTGTGLSD